MQSKQTILDRVNTLIDQLPAGDDKNRLLKISSAIANDASAGSMWPIALAAGTVMNAATKTQIKKVSKLIIDDVRAYQGHKAATSKQPTTVVFGTSGWREPIGDAFTIENVHKVVRAIVQMMQSPLFMKTCGYSNVDEVKKAGVLLLRDNRFMGDDFIAAAKSELASAGFSIFVAGQCPTGVGSAVLTELGAAGSINFTPSHNAMEYAGLKFNPRDGGPADPELTTLIETYANEYMSGTGLQNFNPTTSNSDVLIIAVDAAKIFVNFLETKSKVFDLTSLRSWLHKEQDNLSIIIDTMHGAVRGYIEAVLGADLTKQLQAAGSLQLLHTEDDYSFHGVKPEPSAGNQKALIAQLQSTTRPLTLACAVDPDADRIRFADRNLDIDMNRFAAIAYANMLDRGMLGGISATVPSSGFALHIARENHQHVFEEAVGFKNFRAALKSGKSILAYEESDGISVAGHTLEKCAIAGFLLALNAISLANVNLSDQYAALQKRYGYFYPDKAGQDILGQTVEGWEQYKKDISEVLEHKLYKVADTVTISGQKKAVESINTIDGLKIIFADKSWILLRPSGTEPKFRYYYEITSDKALNDAEPVLAGYKIAAAGILAEAQKKVSDR